MRRSIIVIALLALAGLLGAAGLTIRDVEAALHPERKLPPDGAPHWPLQDVVLTTSDGERLAAWYLPSKNGAAVVLAHGHGENRAQMLPEAHVLASRGFGLLLFDWRAHGESSGRLSTRGDRERYDLAAAVDWLARRPGVRPGRLGVLGYSRGATVAIEVAACDQRVSAVVAEAASTSMRESLEWDFSRFGPLSRLTMRLWMKARGIDVEAVSPIEHIHRIAPRPVMIVHGSVDDSVPAYMGLLLYSAAEGPKQFWLVTGAGHGGYARVVGPEYAASLASFFEASLLSCAACGALSSRWCWPDRCSAPSCASGPCATPGSS